MKAKKVQPYSGCTHCFGKSQKNLLIEALFKTRALAGPVAQEEQASPADFAVAVNHHSVDPR